MSAQGSPMSARHGTFLLLGLGAALCLALAGGPVAAHGIGQAQAGFVASTAGGPWLLPWLYLGASHMLAGLDHLLFVLGLVLGLQGWRPLLRRITLFSLGHSLSLLLAVLGGVVVSAPLVDLVIGLSVLYTGLDNLGAWRSFFGVQPSDRWAAGGFGLVHGLGLAVSVQALAPPGDGLMLRLLAFNGGVELGQLLALALMVVALWRCATWLAPGARWNTALNFGLMLAGTLLAMRQALLLWLPPGAMA